MKKIEKYQTFRFGIAKKSCNGDFSDNLVKNLCFYVAIFNEDEKIISIYNQIMGHVLYKNLDIKESFLRSFFKFNNNIINKKFLESLLLSLIDQDFDSLYEYNKNCEKYGYITSEYSNIKNYKQSVYGVFSEAEFEDNFYYDENKKLYVLNDHIFENLEQIYGHLDERESFVIGVRVNKITDLLIF